MHDEPDSMLPWYANNTLDDRDRAVIAQQLLLDPDMRREITFWNEAAIHQRRSAAPAAEDIGLVRTLERIRRETHMSAPTKGNASSPPSPSGWSRWLRPDGWLRPAFACALLVVIAESAFLVGHVAQPDVTYRGATPAATMATPTVALEESLLSVVFDPATSEAEIRLLVASQNAWIVGGPGNGGEYYLAVPRDKVVSATDALRANHSIKQVMAATSVPRPQ